MSENDTIWIFKRNVVDLLLHCNVFIKGPNPMPLCNALSHDDGITIGSSLIAHFVILFILSICGSKYVLHSACMVKNRVTGADHEGSLDLTYSYMH